MIVGDKGFAGKQLEDFVTNELGAHLVRPDRKDETPRFGKLGGIRQWVESVFDTLKDQLTLEDRGGRTPAGAELPPWSTIRGGPRSPVAVVDAAASVRVVPRSFFTV